MRHIFLFSDINSYSAELTVRQLLAYDRDSHDEITMFINSRGGEVNSMFGIIDAMDMVQSPIRTIVIGQASSAAAVIAAYGDRRLISEKSEFMLHEAWAMMVGSTAELMENAERVQDQNKRMLDIVSKATGKPTEVLLTLLKKTDAFFSAQQAVAFGLADQIIQPNEAAVLKLSEGINVESSEITFKENGLSEVEILKTGEFSHPEYGNVVVTEQTLNQMIENFNNRVRGIDISFDYTHDNDGGEKPAAFWVKSLAVKDKGNAKVLIAQAEFTPNGRRAIQEKEFKYASADFCINYVNEQGKHFPYVLRGGTLTNRPFIKEMNAIKLSESKLLKEQKTMNKDQLIAELKAQGIDVIALQSQTGELSSKVSTLEAASAQKDTELVSLRSQIVAMNEAAAKEAKEKAFDALLAEGKVVPAQKEKVLAAFKTAEEIKDFYAAAQVVVTTKAKGKEGDPASEELDEAEQAVLATGKFTKEQIIKSREVTAKK